MKRTSETLKDTKNKTLKGQNKGEKKFPKLKKTQTSLS